VEDSEAFQDFIQSEKPWPVQIFDRGNVDLWGENMERFLKAAEEAMNKVKDEAYMMENI
jgi:hypothetical protein